MFLLRSGLFILVSLTNILACKDKVLNQPNIILIVADDLGWNDVSYHDPVHQIPTPNIDALGLNGIILNRHYSLQMCTPSRAALMTGKYPIRIGMQHYVIVQDEPWGLPLNQKLLPEYFKEVGYETYMVGKWHLGFHEKSFTPLERGFHHHYGYWGSNIDYWTKVKVLKSYTPGLDFRNGPSLEYNDEGYVTESFTNVVSDFIKQHNKTNPMLLVLNHLAPHSANPSDPLQAPDDEINKFSFISNLHRRKHAAMVSLLDQSVGKVVTALKNAEMIENSIIVFLSDNGAPSTPPMELNPGSNYPLRGTKNTPWEAGVRVPALIWSPLLNQTTLYSKLFHITDWLPTLLSSAGIEYTEGNFDGVDHWHELKNNSKKSVRTELLVNIDPIEEWSAIIKDNFKLVNKTMKGSMDTWLNVANVETGLTNDIYVELILQSEVYRAINSSLTKIEILQRANDSIIRCSIAPKPKQPQFCGDTKLICLFNIQEDPCEFYDISEEYPELVNTLTTSLHEYEKTMLPPLNRVSDETSDPIYHNNSWVSWDDNNCYKTKILHFTQYMS